MKISEKLASIPKDQVVDRLNQLIDKSTVGISWTGRKILIVKDYEGVSGQEQIDEIVKFYFKSSCFQREGAEPTPKQRMDCYGLGARIRKLYVDGDAALQKTWIVKNIAIIRDFFNNLFFAPSCRCCAGIPRDMIEMQEENTSLFDFTPADFARIWPDKEPLNKGVKWLASKEMVQEASVR